MSRSWDEQTSEIDPYGSHDPGQARTREMSARVFGQQLVSPATQSTTVSLEEVERPANVSQNSIPGVSAEQALMPQYQQQSTLQPSQDPQYDFRFPYSDSGGDLLYDAFNRNIQSLCKELVYESEQFRGNLRTICRLNEHLETAYPLGHDGKVRVTWAEQSRILTKYARCRTARKQIERLLAGEGYGHPSARVRLEHYVLTVQNFVEKWILARDCIHMLCVNFTRLKAISDRMTTRLDHAIELIDRRRGSIIDRYDFYQSRAEMAISSIKLEHERLKKQFEQQRARLSVPQYPQNILACGSQCPLVVQTFNRLFRNFCVTEENSNAPKQLLGRTESELSTLTYSDVQTCFQALADTLRQLGFQRKRESSLPFPITE